MAGVGKILKQAQKMQQRIEEAQLELAGKEIEVTSGGGAITIRVTGQGKFVALKLDPDFLKEDTAFVAETLLAAFQEAADRAREASEEVMQKATAGFAMPGLF